MTSQDDVMVPDWGNVQTSPTAGVVAVMACSTAYGLKILVDHRRWFCPGVRLEQDPQIGSSRDDFQANSDDLWVHSSGACFRRVLWCFLCAQTRRKRRVSGLNML